ncbi:MAG: hypothetical protein H7A45_17515 [Verrucomicrobiales bacterium]|nr:hypothetical protein [Verrucomicrobiales bacterium]
MAYVTIEDRVDRLEALFGQFLTEMALINKRAEEREKAAEERFLRYQARTEEAQREAEDRFVRFQDEMRAFKDEMGVFKDEMRVFKDEMGVFKDEMGVFKDEMGAFKDEMGEFKDEMRHARREMDKKWGALANKMGTIIEDILAPNLRRLAREHFGFAMIEDFMIRRSRRHPGEPRGEGEFDTLVVGPAAVILGEAKSSPTAEHADELSAKVASFFTFFPEYEGRRLIPVLGSWAIPEGVVGRLTKHRIYAMQMGEETMELANAATLEGTGDS